MRKRKRWIAGLAAAALLAAGTAVFARRALPDTFTVEPGAPLTMAGMPWLRPLRAAASRVDAPQRDASRNETLAIFGLIPVKTGRVVEQPRRAVQVCGTPFGVKMFANGALVVGFTDLSTEAGGRNPAKEAGLCIGDLIVAMDGRQVHGNQDVTDALGAAGGRALTVEYLRGDRRGTAVLTPLLDPSANTWRAGMWVRDSSAGIGTLTFYDPQNAVFAGLGHAISDSDTGRDLALLSGEVSAVEVTGYEKGTPGTPGELRGSFDAEEMGEIYANDGTGIYGRLYAPPGTQLWPVAPCQEVSPGPARMVTTIGGRTPRTYSIRIERVSMTEGDPNRNMVIRVTDPRLLQATGGIIQGMSGSPVIQNGRLVGAVTHVLVNDPTRGYAIFAQTMLQKADSVSSAAQAETAAAG